MAKKKRRKKRRGRRDEEFISPKSPSEMGDLMMMNQALKRPLTPQTVLLLQRQYGNGYVQNMLQSKQRSEKDRQEQLDDEATKASEQLAYSSEFRTNTKGMISKEGQLNLDLTQIINMNRYSEASFAQRHEIDSWQGLGQIEMENEQFKDDSLHINRDGKMQMMLGADFLEQLSRSDNPESKEPRAILDFNREFDVELKATLHYRTEDGRLLDSDLNQQEGVFDANENDNEAGFFLKVEIESIYQIRVDDKPEEKRFGGELLLQGVAE